MDYVAELIAICKRSFDFWRKEDVSEGPGSCMAESLRRAVNSSGPQMAYALLTNGTGRRGRKVPPTLRGKFAEIFNRCLDGELSCWQAAEAIDEAAQTWKQSRLAGRTGKGERHIAEQQERR